MCGTSYCSYGVCMVMPFTGFPNKAAAHIALETVRKWLEINADKVSILA